MERERERENSSEKSGPTLRTLGPGPGDHVAALSYQGAGRAVQLDLLLSCLLSS